MDKLQEAKRLFKEAEEMHNKAIEFIKQHISETTEFKGGEIVEYLEWGSIFKRGCVDTVIYSRHSKFPNLQAVRVRPMNKSGDLMKNRNVVTVNDPNYIKKLP